jgi:hypothetical protein
MDVLVISAARVGGRWQVAGVALADGGFTEIDVEAGRIRVAVNVDALGWRGCRSALGRPGSPK